MSVWKMLASRLTKLLMISGPVVIHSALEMCFPAENYSYSTPLPWELFVDVLSDSHPSLVTYLLPHLVEASVDDLQIIRSTSSCSDDVTSGTKPTHVQKLSMLITRKWNHFYQATATIIPHLHIDKEMA